MNAPRRYFLTLACACGLLVCVSVGGCVAVLANPGKVPAPCEDCYSDYATLRGAVIDAINIRERTGVTPEARAIVIQALALNGERCRWVELPIQGMPSVPTFVCD